MSHEEVVIYNLTHNEVERLINAIQGYSNSSFFAQGINRLLKNYIRPHRVKLPGPSYYRIKFHQELTIMLFHLVTFNANLIRQMVSNTYTRKKKGGGKTNDDFSSNMGRFIVARLQEMKSK